jgi:FMN phosphatase YigB (HAD superfamily)
VTRFLAVDLWGTILYEPELLPGRINQTIKDNLLRNRAELDARVVDEAIMYESNEFKQNLRSGQIAGTPTSRLQTITRYIESRIQVGSLDDVIDSTLKKLDGLALPEDMNVNQVLVRFLRERVPNNQLALISNTGWIPSYLCRRLMQCLNLDDIFDTTLFSDEGFRPKPHPEMVLRAAELVNCVTTAGVFIGDDPLTDRFTAENSGMHWCTFSSDGSGLEYYSFGGDGAKTYPTFDVMWATTTREHWS